ncbi:hypothetical protein JW905_06615, partial [bacterium]|nr:hypothetical protein [candidate division CSSED10-310 bacterium]
MMKAEGRRRGLVLFLVVIGMHVIGASAAVEVNLCPGGDLAVMFGTTGLEFRQVEANWKGASTTCTSVVIPGFSNWAYPGEPLLPLGAVRVLIPPGRDFASVEVVDATTEFMPVSGKLPPAQPQSPLSMAEKIVMVPPRSEVYDSEKPFPSSLVDSTRVQYCRGYEIVVVGLRPVQYVPAVDHLVYHRRIELRIHTVPARPAYDLMPCRGLAADRAVVRRMVDNPELITAYRPAAVTAPTRLSRDDFPYVIVTSAELAGAAGAYTFQDLLAHKATRGFPGTIVTMEWLLNHYQGVDNADKLRNFIIDAYTNWNTQYVLLGGDADREDVGGESGDFVVPRRDFYSDTDYGMYDDAIPADMYFCCLDGTFNYDGDSWWAEPNDGPGGGEVDFAEEVEVGRAAVDTDLEVSAFVEQLILYETQDPNAAHMFNALMVGELLWNYPDIYGGDYKDEVHYGSSIHGYTTVGFPEEWTVTTLYDRDLPNEWSPSEIIAVMNSDDVHVINHLGHAYVDYNMRIYNGEVDALTNTVPFFAYSQGCYSGSFDNRDDYEYTMSVDCICEHHTGRSHGAFAFIANSRYGWGDTEGTNGSSQYFDRQFFDAVFGEEIKELGAANQDSKWDTLPFIEYGANRWCAYELTLFGCPQTVLGGGISSAGTIGLDRTSYASGVSMVITVTDLDLNLNPGVIDTCTVDIESTTDDIETVLLAESGPDSSLFTGAITVEEAGVDPGDGVLQAGHGATLTVTYIDEDDGYGGTNIPRVATALADFLPPEVNGITISDLTNCSAAITFALNESGGGMVRYGQTAPFTLSAPALPAGNFEYCAQLQDLQDCTRYLFEIVAEDDAGNQVVDDNDGLYYSFGTLLQVLLFEENMDTDPGWSISGGQWAWGQPTGGGGSYGYDPTSGYTGDNVYGYNLNGDYGNNIPAYTLTTPLFDCSGYSGTTLRFYRWLGVEEEYWDHATVDISTDGGASWIELWSNSSSIYDGAWVPVTMDISGYADGQPDVRLRWTMG